MGTHVIPGARAIFQSALAGKSVQCTLCPRNCIIKEGERGFCFGRSNHDGQLYLDTFGHASGFAVDPIEKKPLFHFFPGTMVLSFGTVGCNLSCRFCQNWNISRSHDLADLSVAALPEAIADKARQMRVPAVAFTYNEPIVSAEYVIETAAACRAAKVRTVAVTNGYISELARKDFFHYIDAANVDLKAFNEDFYFRMCGGHLDSVLRTLVYLKKKTQLWLEITTLVIPGENDNLTEIKRMSNWIANELGPETPLHLTAFHPDYRLRDRQATSPDFLHTARTMALESGLHHVYTGNVLDALGSTTTCNVCGKPIITRDSFAVTSISLVEGACAECGAQLAGRF